MLKLNEAKVCVNYVYKFGSYLAENTVCPFKDRPVNSV